MKLRIRQQEHFRILSAFLSPSFVCLWLARTISGFGDAVFLTALLWQVILSTGSGIAMGTVLLAQTALRLVFLGVGGVIADNLPKRLILFWSDIGRAIVMGTIVALGWWHLLQLWHFVGLAIIFGMVDGFFIPASQAILPELVAKDALASSNASISLSEQLSELLGPVLGGVLVMLAGPMSAFMIDGFSFLVSAVLILLIQSRAIITEPRPYEQGPQNTSTARATSLQIFQHIVRLVAQFFAQAGEGLGYVLRTSWLWISIIVAAAANAAFVCSQVALPFLVRESYGQGAWLLGAIFTAGAAGSLFGTFLVGLMAGVTRRGLLAYGMLLLASVALVSFGLPWPRSFSPLVAPICSFTMGFGINIFGVLWATVMQERVPQEQLGRVTSIDYLGSYSLVPLSYAAVGLLIDTIGASMVFVSFGIFSSLICVVALIVPSIRQIDRRA